MFYWFTLQYGIDIKGLGAIAVGTEALAAISFVAALSVASHAGLLVAAILPHVLANLQVILVPLMPVWWLAVGVWLLRYAFAQMERPARQSYTIAIVPEERRAAASGVTSVSRNAAVARLSLGHCWRYPAWACHSSLPARSSWCTTQRCSCCFEAFIRRRGTLRSAQDLLSCADNTC